MRDKIIITVLMLVMVGAGYWFGLKYKDVKVVVVEVPLREIPTIETIQWDLACAGFYDENANIKIGEIDANFIRAWQEYGRGKGRVIVMRPGEKISKFSYDFNSVTEVYDPNFRGKGKVIVTRPGEKISKFSYDFNSETEVYDPNFIRK